MMTFRQRTTILGLTGAVAFVALICAVFVHHACFEAFPFQPPSSGTPRAGYCDAINPTHPWVSLTLVPALAMLVGGIAFRRHIWLLYLLAALLGAALVGNAIVANSLEFDFLNGV